MKRICKRITYGDERRGGGKDKCMLIRIYKGYYKEVVKKIIKKGKQRDKEGHLDGSDVRLDLI